MLMIYVQASRRLSGVRTKLRRSMTSPGRQVADCIDDPALKTPKSARKTADALIGWAKKIRQYRRAEIALRRENQPGTTYDIRTEDMHPQKDYV
jgi:hypothetical protein